MKRLSWILKSEELWVIILSLTLLGFSYGPLIYNYLASPPPDRVFLGSYGYPPDFWGKIIAFQEGRLGHWFFIHKTTITIPSPASLPLIEYLFLGHLSLLSPVDPIIFFHFCRFLLSLIFLIIIYQLISRVFEKKIHRLIAYCLALFSSGMDNQGATYIQIWSPLGVFQRSAYYPHYLFAFIFSLLSINFLNQALEKKNPKKLFWAGFFGFLTSLIHAPNSVNLYLVLVFYTLTIFYLNWWQKKNFKQLLPKISYLLIYFLVSFLPIIHFYLLSRSYPWNLLGQGDTKFDLGRILPQSMVIYAVGPTLFFSFYGSWLLLKKKDSLSLMLSPWSISYLLGYFVVDRISPYNSQRFLQTPFFVILAILATLALADLSSRLSRKLKIAEGKILIIFALILLSPSWPAMLKSWSINWENFQWAGDYLYFTQPETLAAIRWLGKNTTERQIVLADKINGELIAALAGNFPYVNTEITNFPDELFNRLENSLSNFYRQTQTNEEAKKFLQDNKINFVFWSDQEKRIALKDNLDYPFLTKVYENKQTIIYKTLVQ